MQKLGKGSSFTVPTSIYGVKVGTDIRLFLTGRKSWSDFTSAVATAFVKKIQKEIYAEFLNMASKLDPASQFKKGGALSATTKATFDTLIEDVEMSNESGVVIMGTKTALRNLNALSDVDWRSEAQKVDVNADGILGSYEGTPLMVIPQRFADNDTANKLVDSTKIFIMPVVDYKPIKFIDYGETELEVTEVGATLNDQQSYEVQRRMGVASILTRNFGLWELS